MNRKRSVRPRIATFGERGNLVRLFKDTKLRRYVVQWGPKSKRGQKSYPLTVEGKQEAEAFAKAFTAERVVAAMTTSELWEKYRAARFPYLRPNSRRIYAEGWAWWTDFYGVAKDPAALAKVDRGAFQRHLEVNNLGINTIRSTIRVVRTVYNWAEDAELITRNRWHGFRIDAPKGTEPPPRAEYRVDEFLKIWRELDPTKRGQWRAWAAIGLLGIYGNRQHALLSLEWDWDCGEEIVIPASVEKTGKEAVLPMFPLTRQILDRCREWRAKDGYEGGYVFYAARSHAKAERYTIQSLTTALHKAEKRAGVPTLKGRAGHGFRRGLVGDLAQATGDVHFALQAIGDTMAMAKHYRVRRDDRVRSELAARITRMMTEGTAQGATESATDADSDGFPPPPNES